MENKKPTLFLSLSRWSIPARSVPFPPLSLRTIKRETDNGWHQLGRTSSGHY